MKRLVYRLCGFVVGPVLLGSKAFPEGGGLQLASRKSG